jgi:protein SCO1/2
MAKNRVTGERSLSKTAPRPYGTLLLFAFWALLLAAVYFLMQPDRTVPPELQAVLRPAPVPLQDFELLDQRQQPFDLQRLQGKWSFVFFGYTFCPDICPTTLSTLTGIMRRLADDPPEGAGIQVVFVTVDPARDTPDVIDKYMEYFDPAFIGVTGAQPDIDGLTRQFGAGYIAEPETAPGQYLVSHTSSIFLVDPHGRLLAGFSPPHHPDTIVGQFRQIHSLF